jgi:hypothetical protein
MIKNAFILLVTVAVMTNCGKGSAGTNTSSNGTDSTGQEVRVDVTKTLSTNFTGFGTQYNQNLYAAISATDGITTANLGQLETKVKELRSRYVRIFFDSKSWSTDPGYSSSTADYMSSFIKTVKLAQDAGALTINITFWHTSTPGEMPAFADVLKDLIVSHGFSSVKEVTIQNEPNSTSMTMDNYKSCYTALDQALTNLGIRNRIHFVGGDLVQTNQQAWFSYMGANMSDLLSGYSSHIYWDDNDASKPITRLTEVGAMVTALGAGKKPVVITEYGVRGGNKTGAPDPGYLTGSTTPISQTTVSAMQNALFQVNGMNLGFSGFVRWDCYKAKYDNGTQYYSCIGSGTDGYPLYPLYYMTWLFNHTSEPGWHVVFSSPVLSDNKPLVTAAMTSPNGADEAVYIINRSNGPVSYTAKGLLPNKKYTICFFNNNGNGQLEKMTATSGIDGTLRNTVKANSLVALSTYDLVLP